MAKTDKAELAVVDKEAALAVQAEVDAQMAVADMHGAGGSGPLSLPTVIYGYDKTKKYFSFGQKMGEGEVEEITGGKASDGVTSAEIVILGAPFISRSLYDERGRGGQGESLCRSLDGVVSLRSPQPQARNCDSCLLNQWVPNAQPPAKNKYRHPDGQRTLGCREKYLIPVAYVTGRMSEDDPLVPCLLVVSPTGLKNWRTYIGSFSKSGQFNRTAIRHQPWQVVTLVSLSVMEGNGNAWAVPNFSNLGTLDTTLRPKQAEEARALQLRFLKTVADFRGNLDDQDTEDIQSPPRGTEVRQAGEGNPPNTTDEDLQF